MFEHDAADYVCTLDPRDDVLGTFHYWHPKPIPKEAQYNGVLGFNAGIEQLILIEFLEHQLIDELADQSMALSDKGLKLAEDRLDKWPAWPDYMVRPNAPSLPTISERLLDALRGEDSRNDSKRFEPYLSGLD